MGPTINPAAIQIDLIECAANEVCVPNSSEEKDMAIPSVELG